MYNYTMPEYFRNESGRIYELPYLVERNCIYCDKRFIIRGDDLTTFTCGMQNRFHPPLIYVPGEEPPRETSA